MRVGNTHIGGFVMIKVFHIIRATIVFCALANVGTARAAIVADGGFEAQGIASGTEACRFSQPSCGNGPWFGTGVSGINLDNGQNFAGVTPDGHYYGFLQSNNGSTSTLSQTVSLNAGTYVVSWLAGGRLNYSGAVNYTVSLGNQIFSGGLTQHQAFTPTNATVTLGAGTYDLTFTAHTANGDNSALIDKVSITAAVPEPAMWGLMIGGFGLTGTAMRRSRKATASFA